ncbi:caffeoylshikimate esterase-like isoform X2 [Asparagus officinalis]|uniref:caffeoylshikimate esterase-like isoform X2 n=1 Tax=Asparagus officinalis TaxID=4686 RepID=UPI00098E0F8C|nr:caffeoylshikimate esterase-like isoform X2 [Asparagus officinalis]
MKWEDIDRNLAKMFEGANLSDCRERRKLREAFKDVQLSLDHCLFKSYEVNTRGLEIYSKSWLPENSSIKAIICLCHGYGDTCSFFFEGIAKKLTSEGYGVFALDYPGFGLSEGLHGYIPSFDDLVGDVVEHFTKIKEKPEYKGLPSFLFGESMGGAVALKVHLKQPEAWDGAVLAAPMCKISDDVVPSWAVQQFLIGMAKFLPKRKLVPLADLAEKAFKDLEKREMCKFNVICYRDKPRLRTAVELLRVTREIESRLEEVSLPLLILHGDADVVTDPSVSKALYEKACSSDKKLCLYEDGYHSLLEGESDEIIFKVFGDIIGWLDVHSEKIISSS